MFFFTDILFVLQAAERTTHLAQIAALEADVAALHTDRDAAARAEIDALQAQLDALRADHAEARRQRADAEAARAALQVERDALRVTTTAHKAWGRPCRTVGHALAWLVVVVLVLFAYTCVLIHYWRHVRRLAISVA